MLMKSLLLAGTIFALPISDCLAEIVSPRALVETVDISNIAIAPDGAHAAFREERASIESNDYRSTWFIIDLEAPSAVRRVSDGGVPIRVYNGYPVNEPARWSPDSLWIYYRALFGNQIQVWRASADGRRVETVTRDAANVEAFALSEDGLHVTYRVGATREATDLAELNEYARGIRFDETIHGGHNLYRSFPMDGQLRSPRFRTGNRFRSSIIPLLSDEPPNYRSMNLSSGIVSPASDGQRAALEDGGRPNSRTSDVRAMVRRDARTAVLAGTFPASRLTVSSAGRRRDQACSGCGALAIDTIAWAGPDQLVLAVRRDPANYVQNLYAWNLTDDHLFLVAASEGQFAGGRRIGEPCAAAAGYAICVYASAIEPPRLERIDLASGERTILYSPNVVLAHDAAESIGTEQLEWTDTEGRQFTGHLLVPRGAEPRRLPLFVTYYNCPGFLRGGVGDEWPLITLAGIGIAALCINHPPLDADAIGDYEIARTGVEAIVRILGEQGIVDVDRVGMGGVSFGSEAATWIAGHSNVLAAVSIASVQITPHWYWNWALQSGFAQRAENRWGIRSPQETPEQWQRLSPTFYVDDIRTPFLMQLPEGEFRANLEFHALLVRRGVPTEFWMFPEETHQKYQPIHRLVANERNVDWFRFWLQDYREPDPNKAEQYDRWSGMRAAWLRRNG